MTRPDLRPALLLAALLFAPAALAGELTQSAAVAAAEPQTATEPQAAAETRGHAVPAPAPAPAPGEATRRLLEQQRAGHFASRHDQWLSGDVQREVYQRYVNSFSQAIPETFIDDSFSD